MVRPGRAQLDRAANESKGVLSKHDSMLKAADFESDFRASCIGEFSLPDLGTWEDFGVEAISLRLISTRLSERKGPKR